MAEIEDYIFDYNNNFLTRNLKGTFEQRLNKILPKMKSSDFGKTESYVFDYPPERELQVRDYIRVIQCELKDKKIVVVNLLKFLLDYIDYRGYGEKFSQMIKQTDNTKTLKAVKAIATVEKLSDFFIKNILVHNPELILISGVGSVHPMIQVPKLLNNLRTVIGKIPLVLFYPGVYDKMILNLFGQTEVDRHNYYRADFLVD
jgi:hypothetical protein